ncbi:hypothetical protein QE197_13315 [Arsenophonus nasoniae]|uniref:Uncharacterized protein n=1 Tax=Arsenophonus nasoniae TaxID=638 RepID=D2TXT1_9GAMM|nr:hypothetical protein [Arsenophonus nasoniae]QBY44463.1 hypothetical protein ArsFIN_30490 [Arsenophonus nasoniae]WGM00706.1 hypothetical protein QE210_12690 [Arsenophonus nasoniae]WGM04734.1 hypothetical protein QE258_14145 [Arsenophonus nasoniae]WGM09834.1 hypothetical protein QE197_13315 [Arsenophonus nasoniae]WGM14553.1 hypothetical protein QE193_13215 [Arsenophonus nasoniae]
MKWRLKIFTISLLVGFSSLSSANNNDSRFIYTTENQNDDLVEIINLQENKHDKIKDICMKKFNNSPQCDNPKFINRFALFLKNFPDKKENN